MLYFLYQDGETALYKASCAGQTAVVTVLLDHGADVHAVSRVGDCSTGLGVFVLYQILITVSRSV